MVPAVLEAALAAAGKPGFTADLFPSPPEEDLLTTEELAALTNAAAPVPHLAAAGGGAPPGPQGPAAAEGASAWTTKDELEAELKVSLESCTSAPRRPPLSPERPPASPQAPPTTSQSS